MLVLHTGDAEEEEEEGLRSRDGRMKEYEL